MTNEMIKEMIKECNSSMMVTNTFLGGSSKKWFGLKIQGVVLRPR